MSLKSTLAQMPLKFSVILDRSSGSYVKQEMWFMLGYEMFEAVLMRKIGFTIRGGLESGTEVAPVVINVRGYFKEMDFDTWKPAEKATLKCSVACKYYKLNVNNTDMIEIDPVNMVRNVNGVDQLAKLREALQI